MKKYVGKLATIALVAALVIGGTMSVSASRGYHHSGTKTTNASYHNGYSDAEWETYRQERYDEYAKFIEDKVADGSLSRAEADDLKTDVNRMHDYCSGFKNNSVNNEYRSSRGGGGPCHNR